MRTRLTSAARRLLTPESWRHGLCLGLIAGLTYLFIWRLWAPNPEERGTPPAESDLVQTFYPPRYFAAQALARGELALWNPHTDSGYPQFADPQAATFYPPALLLAFAAGQQFSFNTLLVDIAGHYFLVGLFMYLFLYRLVRQNLPALCGAIAYEFGGYITSYPALQLSELEAAVWLPATLLMLTLAVERRQIKWTLLAGLPFSLVFLAGRPQSYLTIAPLSLAWLVYYGRQQNWRWRAIAGHAGLFLAAGVGLAAVQWLPTLQLTRLSLRTEVNYLSVSEGGFPPREILGALVPRLAGSNNFYVGALTLVLAGLAVSRRLGRFWTGTAAIFLLVSLGRNFILLDAFYLVQRLGFPGYIRNVERVNQGTTFCLAVLCAYGLAQLSREPRRVPRPVWVTMLAGSLAALLTAWLWTYLPGEYAGDNAQRNVTALITLGLLFGWGLLSLWLSPTKGAALRAAWVALIAIDVLSLNQGRIYALNQPPLFAQLKYVTAAPPGQDALYRVEASQIGIPELGNLTGLDTLRGLPPLVLRTYDRLLNSLDDYRRNILLNVEILVTYGGELNDPAYQLIQTVDGWQYHRFGPAHPRAYLVTSVIEVPDLDQAAARLNSGEFDHWSMAIVTGQPNLGLADGPPLEPTETAQFISRTANSLAFTVTAQSPRFLVVADTNYPGWVASLDGQPVLIHQTNLALRGVLIPPGQHQLVMRFQPPVFYLGLGLSGLTALILLSAWASVFFRRRYSPATSNTQTAPLV